MPLESKASILIKPIPAFMIQRFKITLLWVFKCVGLFALSRLLTRRCFTIVGWHGVSFSNEHERLPAYFVSAATLQKRLAFLKKHFQVVSLDELIRQRTEGRMNPRQVALTFDDGMYNFAARAVPVLKEFGYPATVYIVSNTMQERVLTYILLIQDVVFRSTFDATPAGLCEVAHSHSLRDNAAKQSCFEIFKEKYLKLPEDQEQQEHFIIKLAEGLGVDIRDDLSSDTWRYMRSEEIRALADRDMSAQLHTHRHHDVVHYPDTVFEEARTCREHLERVTGKTVIDYCYPSGYWEKRAWKPLQDAGVRSAVTCNSGLNTSKTPLLALRRHIDTDCMSQIEFEFALSGLQWILYSLVRRNTFFEMREVT